MISVAAVLSLRNYPTMALYGWSSIAWYLLGTLLFMLPLSLAAAELASGWPEDGGLYAWVREAFGETWGFIAVWCAFSQNLIWYPTVLSYIAAAFALALAPQWADDPLYNLLSMLGVFWATLLINLRGTAFTGRLTTLGAILGTLIPGAAIVLLWAAWMFLDKPSAIPFSAAALVPELSLDSLPFVASLVLMFAGIEMSGYYATGVRHPQRDYPRGMFLAAAIVLLMSVVPTLALAWVIPAQRIDLNAGVAQALGEMFAAFGLHGLGTLSALLLGIGGVALMTTWMVGPALGLGVVARDGLLPPLWNRRNAQGIPVGVMLLQGAIGSLFILCYVLIPSVNDAYWIMSAMTSEVLAVMYLLIFAAVIRLRYSQPERPRVYRIPGGLLGVWGVAGTGLLALLLAACLGLLPPRGVEAMPTPYYVMLMLVGTAALAFTPLAFLALRRVRRDAGRPVADD